MNTDYILALLLLVVLVYFIKVMPRKNPTFIFEDTASPFYDK